MQVEQREDGKWLCTGKTYAHRDQLKALGGRWQADEKAWLLPSGTDLARVQQLALQAFESMDAEEQSRFEQRQALLDTGAHALHARDAKFSGETFSCKEVLRGLGARWDGQNWVLQGDFDKRVLEQRLNAANLDWRYYRPNMGRDLRYKGTLFVVLEFDAEKHAHLAPEHCDCAPAYTCDRCRYACCGEAVPWTEAQLAAEWLVGVVYDCPVHGRVDYSYV